MPFSRIVRFSNPLLITGLLIASFADHSGAVHTSKARAPGQISLASIRGLPSESSRLHESDGQAEELPPKSAPRWTAFYGERRVFDQEREKGNAAERSPKLKHAGRGRKQIAEPGRQTGCSPETTPPAADS